MVARRRPHLGAHDVSGEGPVGEYDALGHRRGARGVKQGGQLFVLDVVHQRPFLGRVPAGGVVVVEVDDVGRGCRAGSARPGSRYRVSVNRTLEPESARRWADLLVRGPVVHGDDGGADGGGGEDGFDGRRWELVAKTPTRSPCSTPSSVEQAGRKSDGTREVPRR